MLYGKRVLRVAGAIGQISALKEQVVPARPQGFTEELHRAMAKAAIAASDAAFEVSEDLIGIGGEALDGYLSHRCNVEFGDMRGEDYQDMLNDIAETVLIASLAAMRGSDDENRAT